jgi:ribosomal protein S18 acetylase RimI-like enzyme
VTWTRLALPSDAADVARLIVGFRDWLGSTQPSDAQIAASVEILLADANTQFVLGGAGDGPACGVCQLRYRHSVWTGTPDCWLEDLFVEDASRGAGVGRALVEAALEAARDRGAARIELDTNETNTGAIALYERLGFSSRSKTHDHLSGRDIFMGRRL